MWIAGLIEYGEFTERVFEEISLSAADVSWSLERERFAHATAEVLPCAEMLAGRL
jgi:hypothetical protein